MQKWISLPDWQNNCEDKITEENNAIQSCGHCIDKRFNWSSCSIWKRLTFDYELAKFIANVLLWDICYTEWRVKVTSNNLKQVHVL